jgi:uncharacterized protein (DUF849 family)
MSTSDKVVITCALNGVLTDPQKYPVPYTPEEMAEETKRAYDAGASVVHLHVREQNSGRFPSWDPGLAGTIVDAIKEKAPDIVINLTTGIPDDSDEVIQAPLNYLEELEPEMAAMNSGSLNYLGIRSNGDWKWPPLLFKNPVEKVEKFLEVMYEHDIIPECECFDTGIVRSLNLYQQNGILERPFTVSFIQGVESGMPARKDLLPVLIDEAPDDVHWQSILIGREEIWPVHRKTAELGGHLRTGVEDTFYLPDGEKVDGNGPLIEQLVEIAREVGREPATPDEARDIIRGET